jgi:ABC-2 type transport system permease protein
MSATRAAGRALRRLGFRQTLRGAVILGLVSGLMLILQGVAFQKSYPDAASQAKFASTLTDAPVLGILYGDAHNLTHGSTGYMYYRVAAFMGLVASCWGLFTVTRLLRGSEEDGRWEVIRSGATTARAATRNTLLGFGGAWVVSYVLATLLTTAVMSGPDYRLSFGTTMLITLAILLPALLAGGLGAFTSQLAVTRQRALLYGLLPLVALFLIRGLANTNHDFFWLMGFTPYGWIELLNPIIHARPPWLLLFVGFAILFAGVGIGLAQRDLGASVLKQNDTAHSRFFWLRSSWQLSLRQNITVYGFWVIGALFLSGLMASISHIASAATADSPALNKAVTHLGSSNDAQVAFLGAGLLFLVMVLMVFSTTFIGSIRRDEAKQYLDNLLVQPLRRTTWLTGRLLVGVGVLLVTALAAAVLTYVIGVGQHISLHFWKVLANGVALLGTVSVLFGLGAAVYGLCSRLGSLAMYVVLTWSFVIQLVGSAAQLPLWLQRSSLFHYTTFNLGAWPDWKVFGLMVASGVILGTIGVKAFTRRDIIVE